VTALSERLLILALAWGAFAFGAVYSWAYWPLAIVIAGIGVDALVRTRGWRDQRIRTLAIAFAAVAAAMVVQLIALPYSVVLKLSPALDHFFREYALFYHPASLHSLSLSWTSTLVVLALFAALSLLFFGLLSGLGNVSLEWLMNQILGLGLALAIVGVVQKAFPMDINKPLVYGFWEPRFSGTPFGPFINRNHFAGWMVMALPLVAGYSFAVLVQTLHVREHTTSALLRWLTTVDASRFLHVAFCALLMGMSLVLTGSRSGIASFGVAMTVFVVLAIRHFRSRRARAMVGGYLGVLLLGAIIWAGTDQTVGRFLLARTDSSGGGRVAAWQDTLRIVSDFPLFGTGMGTYGQAMLVYQTHSRPVMYVQAHNEYLQVAAEGGILVVVPAVAALGLVLAGIRRRLTSGMDDEMTAWVRVGAVAGLAGIAAQSLVEFSLQMPGNALLFVVLLAIALHRSRGKDSSRERRGSGRLAYRV
jgi:O-antigen ligase